MNELCYTHEMNPGIVQPVQMPGMLWTGGSSGDVVRVKILRDGSPSSELNGQTITGFFIRPDKQTVAISGTSASGVVSVILPQEAYAYEGQCQLVIRATSSGVKIPVFAGYVTVGLTSTDEVVDPGDLVPDLEDLLAAIDDLEDATAAANDLIDGFEDRISVAVVRSPNLYNSADRTEGLQLYSDGTEHSESTFDTSDYIPVTPGVKYYAGYWVPETGEWGTSTMVIGVCAWYTSGKVLITPTVEADTLRSSGAQAPSSAAYMRFSINHGTITNAAEYVMIVTGGLPAAYIGYWTTSRPLTLMQHQADYVTQRSVNLYNSRMRLVSTDLSNSTGNIGKGASFDTSELIDLFGIPSGTYLRAGFWNTSSRSFGSSPISSFAFYKADGTFLSGGSTGLGSSTGVAIPENARYFRFRIRKSGTGGVSYAPLTAVLAPANAFPSSYVDYFELTEQVGSKADVYRLDGSIAATATISSWAELMTAASTGGVYALACGIKYGDSESDADVTFTKDFTLYGRGYRINCGGSSNTPLIVTGGAVSISDCDIYNAGNYMISASGGSLTVRNCYMHVAKRAFIRGIGTAIIHASDCEMTICTADDGFSLDEYASGYLTNCLIHGIADEGISTHGHSYCEVRNCEVYYCGYKVGSGGTVVTTQSGAASSWGGIHLGGGGMGKVIGCYSHHNRTYGIALYHFNGKNEDDSEECTGNTCEFNGYFIDGSTLTRSITTSTPTLVDPYPPIADADTGSGGILLCGCHDLDCANNNVRNNAGYGIRAGLDGLKPNMGTNSTLCAGRIRHNRVTGSQSGMDPANAVDTVKVDEGCDGGLTITEYPYT